MKNVPRSIKDRYEVLGVVGEGAYGVVLKAQKRDSNTLVAIKYFKQAPGYNSDVDIIERELKILQSLRFENVVELLEWFHDKKRYFLIFEYVEWNMLQVLQEHPGGLPLEQVRRLSYQLFRAIYWCHANDIIHRDIKPENLLISKDLILKLCDFGFARFCNKKSSTDHYTDYVATRWYRAPELLIGLPYGKPVDIWGCGCIMAELKTGRALFAGESDIDQLYRVQKCLGTLPQKYISTMQTNPRFKNLKFPPVHHSDTLEHRFGHLFPSDMMRLFQSTLRLHASDRLAADKCIQHEAFLYLNEKKLQPKHQRPPKSAMTPTSSSAQSEASHTNKSVPLNSPYTDTRLTKSCDENSELKVSRQASSINANHRSVESLTDIPYDTSSRDSQQMKYSHVQLSDRSTVSQYHQPKIIGTQTRMRASFSDDQLNQPYLFTPRGSNKIRFDGNDSGDMDQKNLLVRKRNLRPPQTPQLVPRQDTSVEIPAMPSPRPIYASNGVLLRPKQSQSRNILHASPKDGDKKFKRYSFDQCQRTSENLKSLTSTQIYRSSIAFTPIQKSNQHAAQMSNLQNGSLIHPQVRDEWNQDFRERQSTTREFNRDASRTRTVDYPSPGETTDPLPQRTSSRQSQIYPPSTIKDQTDIDSRVSGTSKSTHNFEQPLYYKHAWNHDSRKPVYASDSYLMNMTERNPLFNRIFHSSTKGDYVHVNKINIPSDYDPNSDLVRTPRSSMKQSNVPCAKTPFDSSRKHQSNANSFVISPSVRPAVVHVMNCVVPPTHQRQQSSRFVHVKPHHHDS